MAKSEDVNPASEASTRAYEPAPVVRDAHSESHFTRVIEQQTARLPSDFFLFSALGSMALSLILHLTGKNESSRFVGMWAPALLTMGVYNKIVKLLRPR
jgi:hypothetical protein